MRKKYLRTVPKTVDSDKNAKSSGGKDRRRFSTKTIIIVLAVFLVVSVAITVPLCIFYIDTPIKPSFSDFNQENDYSITITWNKITVAKSYEVEFSYSDPTISTTSSIIKGSTVNPRFTIQRSAGNLYFRVRAVKSNGKGKYSDWIVKEIQPWSLSAPEISIDPTSLLISWTPVTYRYYNDYSNKVPAYICTYGWKEEGAEKITWMSEEKTVSQSLKIAVHTLSPFAGYYQGFSDGFEWTGDVTFYVKVAALNYGIYPLTMSKEIGNKPETQALNQIYNEIGTYGETSIVITQDVFDAYVQTIK